MSANRLFVAVWPPGRVASRLTELRRAEERGVRWVPSANLHVTIRFLDDADPDVVWARLAGLRLPAAEAHLGPTVQLLGRTVLMVPVAGLDEIAGAVEAATADLGEPPHPRGFTGHLTLARLRPRARTAAVGVPFTATFAVRELLLVNSTLAPGGSQYEVLHRLALGPVGA